MKIMHLGDLHIGKKINGHILLEDQAHMLKQYIQAIDEGNFDCVIIAGDIYDRAIPSVEAIQLFEDFIQAVNIERQIPILAISGNHDGASRLNFGHHFFKHHQFYLNTNIEQAFEPVIINDNHFYLVPYIDVELAKHYFDDTDLKTHGQVYARICETIEKSMNQSKTNVLVSHLFVTGGMTSDSEKALTMGTIENVDINTFQAFDLVLLGHLHHPFAIDHPKVFYSGSMLKFSFSEVQQPKGFRVVSIDDNIQSQFVPLKPLFDMEHVVGDFESVMNKTITPKNKNSYIKFELSGLHEYTDPMRRLKAMYPNTLELKPIVEALETEAMTIDVTNKTDYEIIETFYESFHNQSLSKHQQETIQHILKELQNEAY